VALAAVTFGIAVIAAAFPVITAIILYYTNGTLKKLCVLLGISLMFAALTAVISQSKVFQIFAATAT
jgi:hypothetical protein